METVTASTRVGLVPQRAKNFRIASVGIRPAEPVGWIRTGADRVVPSRFVADVQLAEPELAVSIDVTVAAGGLPVVRQMLVQAGPRAPLASSTLRRVLLDPIVRAAVAEASQPATDRPDIAPGAFQVSGEPDEQAWVSAPAGAGERVRQVARLYNEALSAGSRSPAVAVSDAVHISRSQAARYIRKARELGLIPPVGAVTGAAQQETPELPGGAEWQSGYGPIPFTSFPAGPDGHQAGGHR